MQDLYPDESLQIPWLSSLGDWAKKLKFGGFSCLLGAHMPVPNPLQRKIFKKARLSLICSGIHPRAFHKATMTMGAMSVIIAFGTAAATTIPEEANLARRHLNVKNVMRVELILSQDKDLPALCSGACRGAVLYRIALRCLLLGVEAAKAMIDYDTEHGWQWPSPKKVRWVLPMKGNWTAARCQCRVLQYRRLTSWLKTELRIRQ